MRRFVSSTTKAAQTKRKYRQLHWREKRIFVAMDWYGTDTPNWQTNLVSWLILAVGAGLGLLLQRLVNKLVARWMVRYSPTVDYTALRHVRRPLRALTPLVLVLIVSHNLRFTDRTEELVTHVLNILLILCISWVIIGALRTLREAAERQYNEEAKDNFAARRLYTQFNLLQSILTAFVIIVALAAVLMTFQRVREIGLSLLASAGVAGIIIGLAAQRTISQVIAGIQIAMAQPIRVDDVVIVEGKQGVITEINITFVVVHLYDLSNLLLPVTYFLEKPFENLTRKSNFIYGTAYVYTDHRVDVAATRAYYMQMLRDSGQWDGKYAALYVTKTTEQGVELRLRMSAPNPDIAWELSCLAREQVLAYLRDHQPQALPQSRLQIVNGVQPKA